MATSDFELQWLRTRGAEISADVERALHDGSETRFHIDDVGRWHVRALDCLEAMGHERAALEKELGGSADYVDDGLAQSYGRLRAVMAALEASRSSAAAQPGAATGFAFDVFISYSDKDRAHAESIHAALVAAGLRAFMAAKSLRPGDDFAERIREALLHSRELWLLVTPNSAQSDWVLSEWGAAWVLKRRIVPILLRYAPGQLPDRLRQLHTVDFHDVDTVVQALASQVNAARAAR